MKYLYYIFSFLLLVYLILPGPSSIFDFPPLPSSTKSYLSGDTWQIPNIVAYFSNNYRDFTTSYYRQALWQKTWFPFPPIIINYPPEYAFAAVKDQTQSTYLEEYVYPLRESLYVNGLEEYYSNGLPKFWGSHKFEINGIEWDTKVTLRYYPSSIAVRIMTWLGINLSVFLIIMMFKRIFKHV